MGEYMRENTLHYPSSGLRWNGEEYLLVKRILHLEIYTYVMCR